MDKTTRAVVRLVEIMAQLRSPGGCPWDAEQTPESLKPYLLEETYEVLEAIDSQATPAICEELGDLLLQIVFQTRIFEERGSFDLGDVAEGIAAKLVRRHPHVFAGQTVSNEESLLSQWERIKGEEKSARGETGGALDGVPPQLPALMRARKLTEKASRAGFAWNRVDGAFAKLEEELGEFRRAFRQQDQQAMADELGDILFATANLGRYLKIDPEEALRQTINRFICRFRCVERTLAEAGRSLEETSPQELQDLWQQAKSLAGRSLEQ